MRRSSGAASVALAGAASAHGAPGAGAVGRSSPPESADNYEYREAGELKRQAGPEDAERVVGATKESDT
jgi:hypothetical protein